MNKNKLVLVLVAGLLSSCASDGGLDGVKPPDYKPAYVSYLKGKEHLSWTNVGDIRGDVGPKPKIIERDNGEVILDLVGGEISGKNLPRPKNIQDENSVGVKTRIKNFTVRGGYISGIPGGIISYAPNSTFEKIIFTNIGEDAISNAVDLSPGFTVRYCEFYGSKYQDKENQLNDSRDALIENSYFTGGITSVRLQKLSGKYSKGTAIVRNNVFEKVRTAMNVSGKSTVTLSGNVYKGVGEKYVTTGNGKVIDKD